jgi:hypothetical protein
MKRAGARIESKRLATKGRQFFMLGGAPKGHEVLPEKSYKRKCQETDLAVGSVPTLFCLGIQPNRLNVHARSASVLPQEVVASFRHSKR